jgi:hypothetical protein
VVSTLSTGILILFFVSALLAFLVPFFSDRVAGQLSFRPEGGALKHFGILLAAFVILFILAQLWKIVDLSGLGYFAIGLIVPFLLARFGLPPRLVGVLLLLVSVLVTVVLPATTAGNPAISLLLGITTWKLSENLIFSVPALEDALPSLIWLAGSYWIGATVTEAQVPVQQGLLLSSISIAMVLRMMQSPLFHEDKFYLKRLILSASGGLALLIVMTKLLLIPDMAPLAALVGAGYFCAYLMDWSEPKVDVPWSVGDPIKYLILIGIFTLLAQRMFGTFGLIVLSPVALVGMHMGVANIAGTFWIARAFLQGFIYQFVPNVTGINLTHAYSSAGLYAGFLLILLMSVFMRDATVRWVSALIVLAGATLTPAFSNYLMHDEPTGALLVASAVAAVMLGVCAPVLYRTYTAEQGSLLLLPIHMTGVAVLTSSLLSLGDESTQQTKLIVIGVTVAVVMLVSALVWYIISGGKRSAPAAEASE